MEINLNDVRKKAKDSINNNRKDFNKIFLLLVIINLVTMIFGAIPFVGFIFILASIYLGVVICFLSLKVIRREPNEIKNELFNNVRFAKYTNSIFGNFLLGIILTIPATILVLAGVMRFFERMGQVFTYSTSIVDLVYGIVSQFFISFAPFIIPLIIVSIIIYIIGMSISFMYYVAYDAKDDVKATDILSLSNAIVKGRRKKYFALDIKFILITFLLNVIRVVVMYYVGYFGVGTFILNCAYFGGFALIISYKRVYFGALYESLLATYNDEYGRTEILKSEVLEDIRSRN